MNERLITENEVFVRRAKGVGVLSAKMPSPGG
jgi:NADH:ubiquinone oxidoreductase subunit D